MRKILLLILLLGSVAFGYESKIPIGATYSEGGVATIPTSDSVFIWDGPDSLTLEVYTSAAGDFDSNLYMLTDTLTKEHDHRGVWIFHHIVYPSSAVDYQVGYYEAPYGGSGFKVCKLQITDTASGVHTALAGARVQASYTTGEVFDEDYSNTSGIAYINVNPTQAYTVDVRKAGHDFDSFTLLIPALAGGYIGADSASVYASTSAYQYIDTIPGDDNTSSSLCAVYFTMKNFPGTGVDKVTVTTKMASRNQIYNTCSDSWYPEVEQFAGRTNSSGYITFNIPRSSCIDDKKIEIRTTYGSETRKIGKWTIPDSSSHELTFANKD